MELKTAFTESVQYVNNNKTIQISDEHKLEIYKYFKQVTVGNINIDKPNIFNYNDLLKWDAWNSIKNMSNEEAMKNYINLVNKYRNVNIQNTNDMSQLLTQLSKINNKLHER